MRISIVDDLAIAREALRRVLSTRPDYELAWQASDGAEACAQARADTPDLILMDIVMPIMDGVEATHRIMLDSPCPILVVTSSVDTNVSKVFEALGYGALDAVDTPRINDSGAIVGGSKLLEKIEVIARLTDRRTFDSDERSTGKTPVELVAVGASTGGPLALSEILPRIREGTQACVVVAQHVDAAFAPGLAEWLSQRIGQEVQLVRTGMRPEPGAIFMSATNDHLVATSEGIFEYVKEPHDVYYRPSVDTFFNSLAAHYSRPGVAVLLTGMGRDGAKGMLKLRKLGWRTIAQDEATSVVWGMPRAACELGAAELVLPLDEIGRAVAKAIAKPPDSH